MNNIFEQLIAKKDLTSLQTQQIIQTCMDGQLTDVQIAAFLALMRMKGESIDELSTAAKVMLKFARHIDLGDNLIDIVGTGGDKKNTFNISTVSSFVAAAAGARVAKHGNYSFSSNSGSADFLLHAGFSLELDDEQLQNCMQQCGISFLFAPSFHPAMHFTRKARQQLGIRTLFNLLGPLINPAQPKTQIIGVFENRWLTPLAHVLAQLGSQHALIINSRDGMDEISIAAITDVTEYHQGQLKQWTIDPKDYGCFHASLDAITVDSPRQSLALAEAVFKGQQGPARDIVLLNSALALYATNHFTHLMQAFERAQQAIDSGEAWKRFTQLKQLTQQKKP